MKLTDKACKNAQPKQKPFKMTDGDGLYLEVMPNGSKCWRMKYRITGKRSASPWAYKDLVKRYGETAAYLNDQRIELLKINSPSK